MVKSLMLVAGLLGAAALTANAATPEVPSQPPSVQVEAPHLSGPRELAAQTQQGAIRDYLDAWQAMRQALERNQPGLLSEDFVGTAKDKLTDTIHQQVAAGLHARYQDRSHDLQIVFYSPEGLSIELIDTVNYDVQIFDHDHPLTTQHAHARFVVLLTPAQVRWRVRVLQSE